MNPSDRNDIWNNSNQNDYFSRSSPRNSVNNQGYPPQNISVTTSPRIRSDLSFGNNNQQYISNNDSNRQQSAFYGTGNPSQSYMSSSTTTTSILPSSSSSSITPTAAGTTGTGTTASSMTHREIQIDKLRDTPKDGNYEFDFDNEYGDYYDDSYDSNPAWMNPESPSPRANTAIHITSGGVGGSGGGVYFPTSMDNRSTLSNRETSNQGYKSISQGRPEEMSYLGGNGNSNGNGNGNGGSDRSIGGSGSGGGGGMDNYGSVSSYGSSRGSSFHPQDPRMQTMIGSGPPPQGPPVGMMNSPYNFPNNVGMPMSHPISQQQMIYQQQQHHHHHQQQQHQMYSPQHQMSPPGHIMNSLGRSGYVSSARGMIVPPRPPLNAGPYGRSAGGPSPTSMGISSTSPTPGTGGSNAQGRAINKMLLDVLRSRIVDPNRLALIVDANIERMDCVNLATLLFHTGKKRLLLTPLFIKRIATRFSLLKEELRAREASNALYGLKCMSSDTPETRQLILALAHKVSLSQSDLVAQAVGNAIYGCQMMTSDHEEVRFLLQVLAVKVIKCTELLEAQNVGNALYGLRGMNSDYKEVRMMISALTPKIASAKEDLNGQALGNSLYGLQCMSAKESEVRVLLVVLSEKTIKCWENLKAQEVGNLLYGLKRMNSDILEVRNLIDALVPKIQASPEILDAQAIGNSFYGMQNMKSDNQSVLELLKVMADKVSQSVAELDGQAMGNSLYGLQGMRSENEEVRAVLRALTLKIDSSSLEMNAQELGNALYGLQNMTSDYPEVRSLLVALARKVASSKHDLTSQEIGNAIYGLQGMRSNTWETRLLARQLAMKISRSTALLDPQGIANSLYGFQRMSSESEEVRMLIQALATKIEQSWKLLNAQHIANSIYGLQNLSSFEVEVLGLVKVLVPKVISCRDDMTSKQISCAFFGLQSMYSQHEDVIALISALTEKVALSKDIMSGLQLGSALFGLQGLDDSTEEVRKLIAAFAVKIINNVKDIEPPHLGNCFFGLQRMSTISPEVCELVNVLAPLVMSVHTKNLDFGPLVCGNILYGLQNCSWSERSVVEVIRVISGHVKDYTSICLKALEYGSISRAGLQHPEPILDEIISLYQSLTLTMGCYPNMEEDIELRDFLYQQQNILFHVIESRKHEKSLSLSRDLTIPQIRLSEGMRVILYSEPFEVTSGELLWGFETTTVVSLKPGISLTTNSGLSWNPVLNIEILGSSHSFPSKDLFTRLRNRYLFEERGVTVEMIHATMVASGAFGKGVNAKKGMIDTLRNQDSLLQGLYPPTMEDATLFSTILFNRGITGPEGIMSSLSETTTDQLLERYRNRLADSNSNTNSFFAIGTLDTSPQSFDGFTGVTNYEYIDDNLENDGLGYTKNVTVPDIRSPYRVMNTHWIGDHPKLSSPTSATSPRSEANRSASTSAATTPQSASTRGSNIFNFASVQPVNIVGATTTASSSSSSVTTSTSAMSSSSGVIGPLSSKNLGSLVSAMPFIPNQGMSVSGISSQSSYGYNNNSSNSNGSSNPYDYTSDQSNNLHDEVTLSLPNRNKSTSANITNSMSNTMNINNPTQSSVGSAIDETSSLQATLNSLQEVVASVSPSRTHTTSESYEKRISPLTNDTEDVTEEDNGEGGEETTDEIALLEAQLEIARIEAKLLQLKRSGKNNSKSNSSVGSNSKKSSNSSSPGTTVVDCTVTDNLGGSST